MYLITNDARVEQTENGLFFYEKDIAFLPYLFLNDLIIEINLTYRYPGIGFCIVKADKLNPDKQHICEKTHHSTTPIV